MDKKQFANVLFAIAENFNFKITNEFWVNQLFEASQKFSENELKKGFSKIMQITQEDWNKKYGYGGKPAIADWLIFFGADKPQDINSIAKMQVAKILIEADRYYGFNYKFENPITNAVVKRYGGLKTIAWELFDKLNDKPKQKEWVAKALEESWLQCHDAKIYDDKPNIVDPFSKTIENYSDNQKLQLT